MIGTIVSAVAVVGVVGAEKGGRKKKRKQIPQLNGLHFPVHWTVGQSFVPEDQLINRFLFHHCDKHSFHLHRFDQLIVSPFLQEVKITSLTD